MKYQNHVASAIKPAIYETPYIGSNAIKIQLEQAKEKREELKEALRQLEERLKQLEFVMAPLATDADTDIKYRVDVLSELARGSFSLEV